jgi:DNA-binding CsgD family transcriptional regulator/type II secretory pathway predicted ATPase ExeA
LSTVEERTEHQDRLRDLFEECRAGHGRVVVLSGPVGSGKTVLLDAFSGWAAAQGATVVSAVGSPTEEPVELGVVNQLLSSVAQPGESAAGERGLAANRALAVAAPGLERAGMAYSETPALHVMGQALLALAAREVPAPLVITVDDAHYADAGSLRCLLRLIWRMRNSRILVLLNIRTGLPPRHPLLHAEVLRQPHCERIRLAPLTLAGVAQLLTRQLDSVPAGLTRAIHAATAGNPLLATALIEDCRAAVEHGRTEPVGGEAFGQAVVGCLCRVEPNTVQVAQVLAVLGETETIGRAIIAQMLDMEPELVAEHLAALEEVGLIVGNRYRHERARAAVRSGITRQDRAELHQRAAFLLLQEGVPAIEVARHLIKAERVEARWAISLLVDAAEQAMDGDDLELAQACLRRAYQTCANDQQRASIQSLLMRVEWWANPAVAARHLDDLVAAVLAGRLRGSRASMLVDHLLWHGRTADAVTVLRQIAESTADPLDAETTRFLLPVGLALFYAFPGLSSTPPFDVGAADYPRRDPDHDAACGVAYLSQRVRFDDYTLSLSLATLGALGRASHLDAISTDDELVEGPPTRWAIVAAVRAAAANRRGDFSAAIQQAKEALTAITPRGWGVFVGLPLATMISAATAAKRYEEAYGFAAMPVPAEMLQTMIGVRYLLARGRLYRTTDRPEEASNDFRACRDLMSSWCLDLPTGPGWVDAAWVRLRLGAGSEERKQLPCGTNSAAMPDHGASQARVELSDAELRVATLAAAGRTNREIAAKLFVTVSTVEQHLTRIYRKLRVNGRADLPAWLVHVERVAS